MSYSPGLHIIAELTVDDASILSQSALVKQLLDKFIQQFSLNKLGEVYHNFEPGGFTAVICLSESHISLHTWPEYKRVNLDIYLSNFKRINDGVSQQIFDELVIYFGASVISKQLIRR